MSLQINMKELQSYVSKASTIETITNAVQSILNQSDMFSASFRIDSLSSGLTPPKINILEMKDIDTSLRWPLTTHEYNLDIHSDLFQAEFQAMIGVEYHGDASISFSALLSLDKLSPTDLAPGCIKMPIRVSLSGISLNGKMYVQKYQKVLVIFFDHEPEINYHLDVSIGAETKLYDQRHIHDFTCEILRQWLSKNVVYPNAISIPMA